MESIQIDEVVGIEDGHDKSSLFIFNHNLFKKWTNGKTSQHIRNLQSMLEGLCVMYNNRFTIQFAEKVATPFFIVLAINGAPIITKFNTDFLRANHIYKFFSTNDLELMFLELSEMESSYRFCKWLAEARGCRMETEDVFPRDLQFNLIYQLLMTSSHHNYRSMMIHLDNSVVFRSSAEVDGGRYFQYIHKSCSFFRTPFVFRMAVQILISSKYFNNVDSRLCKLASIYLKFKHTSRMRHSTLTQLTEMMNTALSMKAIESSIQIAELESIVPPIAKDFEYSKIFDAYKILIRYLEWENNRRSGILIGSIAEALIRTLEELGEASSIFVESGCRILHHLGDFNERISDVLCDLVVKCPSLLGRQVELAKSLKLSDEIDSIITAGCDPLMSTVHPSHPIWLDWAEPRILFPNRYHIPGELLPRCTKVLFDFLDFGTNRGNEKAWFLLWTVVQLVDPLFVKSLWDGDRSTWWPMFHNIPLSAPSSQYKTELFQAFQSV